MGPTVELHGGAHMQRFQQNTQNHFKTFHWCPSGNKGIPDAWVFAAGYPVAFRTSFIAGPTSWCIQVQLLPVSVLHKDVQLHCANLVQIQCKNLKKMCVFGWCQQCGLCGGAASWDLLICCLSSKTNTALKIMMSGGKWLVKLCQYLQPYSFVLLTLPFHVWPNTYTHTCTLFSFISLSFTQILIRIQITLLNDMKVKCCQVIMIQRGSAWQNKYRVWYHHRCFHTIIHKNSHFYSVYSFWDNIIIQTLSLSFAQF